MRAKLALLLTGVCLFVAAHASSQTAPTIEQLVGLRRAGSPVISPDGRWVAYTIRETNWDENAYETEIWVADAQTGATRQLTNAKKSRPLLSWAHRSYMLSGNAGLRWEDYESGHALLPKVSVTLEQEKIPAGLSLAWGKSYRAPSFYSLFWLDDQLAQGNPNLRSEVSTEWIGRMYLDPEVIHGLHTEVNASDQDVENLIYWKRTFDNRWKPFNLSRARVKTLDVAVSQTAFRDRIEFGAGCNWTEAKDATNDRNTGGKHLSFRAPRSYRGTLTLKARGVEVAVNYRWVSARPVFDTNYKWLNAYQVADVRLAYACHVGRTLIEPAIGANNLFNANYRIVRFAPMPEREVYASLRVSEK